jgi:1,4-alpha-glucan branching enzyme
MATRFALRFAIGAPPIESEVAPSRCAAAKQLTELARIGITVIEMMPVAEFPGRFAGGYDGVDFLAP